MSEIRLIALDLDGTTLNSSHRLSDKTIATLRRLSSNGVTIAVVTGRSKVSCLDYIESLALSRAVPVICYNGSMGFVITTENSVLTQKKIFSMPILEEPARVLLKLAEKLGLVAQYYDGDTGEVYAVPTTDEHQSLLDRYYKLTCKKQLMVESFEDQLSKFLSAKILLFTSDPDSLIETVTQELPAGLFHVIRGSPDPFFVEFLLPGVHKGRGLSLLCDHLDISVANVVSFGDGENDCEFLSTAGIGCAMKNARPLAKKAANITLEWTNDEDGVALQLERMEAEGKFRYK